MKKSTAKKIVIKGRNKQSPPSRPCIPAFL